MAELFIVPRQPIEQSSEPEEIEEEDFRVSGEVKQDLETALRAIAFLLDFIDSIGGSDGLRATAEQICKCELPR